ncbi:polyprenol monophosphomannose synthase [Nocardioides bruguierae]|uniref:polyprenol monophosphomannose synthase n=1 Tax=Nocardioides bruguierae TaxID=2945102 RepID=UPI002020E579|nr:polyprenol monophosphomannose synthase [Nocardioides bruguierae]MCL8025421.1 polyprenol monophosphomannose synthase [Nocardioides bruguierae]
MTGNTTHAPLTDPRTLVVVPTYDEAENITMIVRRTLAVGPHVEVLVVDDGSPDGTGEIADALAASESRLHVLHRTEKNGLGPAYLAGFAWALDRSAGRSYDVVAEMDADGSHLPEQLPRLLEALDRADLVLGSRWLPDGAVHGWSRHRELLSRGGNVYVRALLRVPLTDATGGYRVYRAEALRSLDLTEIASAGYCFQVDLARRVLQAGLAVREVPIDFHEREHGASKMTGDIVREALWRVSVWGLADRLHRRGRARAVPVAAPVVALPRHR